MNKFLKNAAVAVASFSVVGISFAQSVPSTTVPTTATALAQSISMSDAQSAGLVIVGLLVGVGVVLWGARLVESKFRPKI